MENHLPVEDHEAEIISAVLHNRFIFVSSGTGSGKSTIIPQILLKMGYRRIVITQPRRISAISLPTYVAKMRGEVLGQRFGYRTGYERSDSPQTQCLYVTDGLELIREIQSQVSPQVLIIDEVHEWNLNIEALVAWGRTQKHLKIIIMSATMEVEALQRFYGEGAIIKIPGRLFPITKREMKYSQIHLEVADLVKEGRNILVFQPGKSEIYKTIELLEDMNVQAQILPLHGELASVEQLKVFEHYDLPKVVISTNVAQTSITIDDINAVISSGIEKRIETHDGIETLARRRISEDDEKQQEGRAGRCGPGIFIDAYKGREVQSKHHVPEIERISLEQIYLRLKINDIDLRQMKFFHHPKEEGIKKAIELLKILQAIDGNGMVLPHGHEISNLPVSVRVASMVLEGQKLKVLGDIKDIAGIYEAKGIIDRDRSLGGLSKEKTSDLLAMLEVYNRGLKLREDELKGAGIEAMKFNKAKEISKKLAERLTEAAQRRGEAIDFSSTGNKQDILKAYLSAQIDRIYIREKDKVRGLRGDQRKIDKFSVLGDSGGKVVIGRPWDLEVAKKDGGIEIKPLLSMCSEVGGEILTEVAPHLFKVQNSVVHLDPRTGKIVVHQQIHHLDKLVSNHQMAVPWDKVEMYLPKGETLESYREDYLLLRFEHEVRSGFLETQEFDSQDERIAGHAKKFCYVYDPLTNEPIYAYPGVIQEGKKTLVRYYFSEAEAQKHTV